ncbi:glycosyltransferase family 2 protein [Haliea sp.]|jgi:glycosyltransferase involved in cell wall biosynthesis|uniref:glycosyltransferase family 2 protein n=1 Tax=Haliea sp. TaxID=1932666 RepID=UPI00352864BE
MTALSVLLPARDEADNIARLLREIDAALATQNYEVILVDDGSGDGTADAALAAGPCMTGRLTVVRHRSGCGQSTALHTAARYASGDILVTLDADGQNDPADISRLLAAAQAQQGIHWIIVGARQQRQDTLWRRFQSRLANGFRQRVLRDECADTGCGLKMLPRETWLELPYFDHMHRFMPALVKRLGGVIVNIPVNHRPRLGGTSKYTAWNRAWVGVIDTLGVFWLNRRTRQPMVAWTETPRSS